MGHRTALLGLTTLLLSAMKPLTPPLEQALGCVLGDGATGSAAGLGRGPVDPGPLLPWGHGGDGGRDGPSGSGGNTPADCSFCEAIAVPGCCSGAWSCPDGECVFRCDNGAEPPLLWDITAIEDAATLAASLDEDPSYPLHDGDVVVHSATFMSWQWLVAEDAAPSGSCIDIHSDDPLEKTPVRIHALIAIPENGEPDHALPGLLVGHNLHGQVEPGSDTSTYPDIVMHARNLGVVAIGISAPGHGLSEGCGTLSNRGGSDCNIFNTRSDPRGSWFYAYALAGMRALTYLGTRPEVDPSRLAVTGGSAGGVMTLLVDGVDRRISAAVPVSASGDLEGSARAGSWVADLLESCDLTVDSEAARHFFEGVDPIRYAPAACGATFLVNGFQDEYFPIHSTLATYEALRFSGRETRWAILPNWDHGYFFFPTGWCATIRGWSGWLELYVDTVTRIIGDFGHWTHRHVLQTPAFDVLPAQPVLSVTDHGDGTATFVLSADDAWPVLRAAVVLSADAACTVQDRLGHALPLVEGSTNEYAATIPLPASLEDLVYWGDVGYELPQPVGKILGIDVDELYWSTPPVLPAGFVPDLRPVPPPSPVTDPCVPGTCTAAS